MLNWDEPLTPISPRAPEPVLDQAPPAVEPMPQTADAALAEAPVSKPRIEEPASSLPEQPPLAAKPINPEDKRVINGLTDINQLAPFKYPWAWEYFLNANRNHWTPLDISMAQDV
ncbi:MAG: ribonucleotide reductase, partial [Gammaproteobacteria bacterium]|nr:ribonucleotide reductase [Gammaproteobacteria bacterium]